MNQDLTLWRSSVLAMFSVPSSDIEELLKTEVTKTGIPLSYAFLSIQGTTILFKWSA
jgi:hypothetical protein